MNSRINTSRRFVRRFLRRERGTQLIELALVLPIVLLLFAATAEFGYFFHTYTTLSKATRAGARHLTSRALNSTEKSNAKSMVVYGDPAAGCAGTPVIKNLSCTNVTITNTVASGQPDTVTVSITGFKYKPLIDLGKLTGKSSASLSIDVSPSSTMKYIN